MDYISIDIDGQNLNARHYAAIEKKAAIEKMQDDLKDNKDVKANKIWCTKAYEACKEAVEKADAPKDQKA